MATVSKPIPIATHDEAIHEYHAEANVLEAMLEQPLKETINPRASVKLPIDGHYQFKHADPFRFEGILSYRSGYTQVAGHPSSKIEGFATLTTSVLEGVNVLDVVTADRVVAQISTVHPVYGKGQVPSVTFLGTRFENLRIGGHKVDIVPNLGILGHRREDDTSYFDDETVTSQLRTQYQKISGATGLPDWAIEEYPQERDAWQGSDNMTCSLVDGVHGVEKNHGTPFGHVIDVPHFGRIYLGELRVDRERGNPEKKINDKYKFRLTMIRLKMGCLATGSAKIVTADSNGTGSGGGHHP